MEVGQTLYYLELGKKFPNIIPCTITKYDKSDPNENVIISFKKDFIGYLTNGFDWHIKNGYIHTTMISALEKRKSYLNEVLAEETAKFNDFVSKVNKWKEKKK